VQVVLIFALSDRRPAPARPAPAAPSIQMLAPGSEDSEWVRLTDPTMFVVPHREGFSGQVWLKAPSREFHPADWTERIRWLLPEPDGLGAEFGNFLQTNSPAAAGIALVFAPETVREIAPAEPIFSSSVLRIEGELAGRKLLSSSELPAQPAAELLTNSVVRVLVDAQGQVFSPPVLLGSSGSSGADQRALDLATRARFDSVEVIGPDRTKSRPRGLTPGTMIFEWRTVPLPATNAPPAPL